MTRGMLFLAIFLTVIFTANAVREYRHGNYALATTFAALPAAFWLALAFGTAP